MRCDRKSHRLFPTGDYRGRKEFPFLQWSEAQAQRRVLQHSPIMRWAAKVDRNHAEIKKALIQAGCSVLDISRLKRCCDLIVARQNRTVAMEIKDGELPESQRKLTAGEQEFRDGWRGEYAVVTSVNEALAAVGVKCR